MCSSGAYSIKPLGGLAFFKRGYRPHTSYLSKLRKRDYIEDLIYGKTVGVIKADAGSLDYSSYGPSAVIPALYDMWIPTRKISTWEVCLKYAGRRTAAAVIVRAGTDRELAERKTKGPKGLVKGNP